MQALDVSGAAGELCDEERPHSRYTTVGTLHYSIPAAHTVIFFK